MSIQPFSKDVAVIQKLDDEPNDVTGLTPAELKLRFDQAAIWLKDYINNTLIPALSSNSSSGGTGASNIGAGTLFLDDPFLCGAKATRCFLNSVDFRESICSLVR